VSNKKKKKERKRGKVLMRGKSGEAILVGKIILRGKTTSIGKLVRRNRWNVLHFMKTAEEFNSKL